MARDSLTDYFYKRLAGYHNKVMWHVWNVEMGVQDSPNIPDFTVISPKDLVADPVNLARGIIHETLNNSGLYTTYMMSVDGKGAWVNNVNTLTIPAVVLSDGTEHLDYIYNHAVAQGYRDNAMHKGIYLNPHPVQGSWPEVAATAHVPRVASDSLANNKLKLQWNTMMALEKIYSQTQLHGLGKMDCIWTDWWLWMDRFNAVKNSPHWCGAHKRFMESMAEELTYCSVCGKYVDARISWESQISQNGTEAGGFVVKCPYCATVKEDIPALEDLPATQVQHATHYCPNCHRFQPSWAPYQGGNQSKVVENLWGLDIYLSQADLVNNILATIGLPYLTASSISEYFVTQIPYEMNAFIQICQQMPTPLWAYTGGVTNVEFNDWTFRVRQQMWTYISSREGSQAYTYRSAALKKAGGIALGLIAVIALIALITRNGVVIHQPYTAAVPLIEPQIAGFGVPRCTVCTLKLLEQWAETQAININPLVGMDYGDGGYWVPWWFTPGAKPDDLDEFDYV